jgi:predicted transcriptional regulator
MTEPVRFSDSITIRVQPEITALVDRAARAKGSKPSEWTRQALMEGLRAAGLDPAAMPARDARALYDSLESEQGR